VGSGPVLFFFLPHHRRLGVEYFSLCPIVLVLLAFSLSLALILRLRPRQCFGVPRPFARSFPGFRHRLRAACVFPGALQPLPLLRKPPAHQAACATCRQTSVPFHCGVHFFTHNSVFFGWGLRPLGPGLPSFFSFAHVPSFFIFLIFPFGREMFVPAGGLVLLIGSIPPRGAFAQPFILLGVFPPFAPDDWF